MTNSEVLPDTVNSEEIAEQQSEVVTTELIGELGDKAISGVVSIGELKERISGLKETLEAKATGAERIADIGQKFGEGFSLEMEPGSTEKQNLLLSELAEEGMDMSGEKEELDMIERYVSQYYTERPLFKNQVGEVSEQTLTRRGEEIGDDIKVIILFHKKHPDMGINAVINEFITREREGFAFEVSDLKDEVELRKRIRLNKERRMAESRETGLTSFNELVLPELTEEQQEALGHYQRQDEYVEINNFYRIGVPKAKEQYFKEVMKRHPGNSGQTIEAKYKDYLARTKEYCEDLDKAFKNAPRTKDKGILFMANSQIFHGESGDVFLDKGLTSTSRRVSGTAAQGHSFGEHLYIVHVPENTAYLSTENALDEVILPRGSRFKVLSVVERGTQEFLSISKTRAEAKTTTIVNVELLAT